MSFRKIKVLVLTSSFPRHKDDWWQRAVLSIYSNMDKKKCEITVISPSGPGAKSKENIDGIKVKRFSYFYPARFQLLTSGEGILYTSKKNRLLGKVQVLTFMLAELFTVLTTMAKKDFDVIHANWIVPQGLVAIIAKFIFRKPVIVTIHGTDIFALKKLNFVKTFILKYCDICTANSSATYETAYKLYPSPKIKIVHMGVDVDVFNKSKRDNGWRKEFGTDPRIILGVGRLIKWKGLEYLIKALPGVLAKFPESKLIIVGKGPEEESLKALTKKLKLEIDKNVFLFGTVGPGKLPYIYASSDVVVSPSVTIAKTGEKEGQGNVVLEAMASGVPVVASRSGGLVDMIDGKTTGLLFEERDHKQLAKNIIRILSDKRVSESLSKSGLRQVREKYLWKYTGERFVALYNSVQERK